MKFLMLLFLISLLIFNGNSLLNQRLQSNNFLLDEFCSYKGYQYNGECFCKQNWKGQRCELPDELDIQMEKCRLSNTRLDYLFNISPNNYKSQYDDQLLPRQKKSIGFDQNQYQFNPQWISMHSAGKKFNIFGDRIEPQDIKQGMVENSYFLASLGALVNIQRGKVIKEMFMTKKDNKNHVYVTRWFLGGKPILVAVDDFLLANADRQNQLIFSNFNRDRDFWAVILEKAWSKIHGIYLDSMQGLPGEVLRAATQAPCMQILNKKQDIKKLFSKLKRILKKNWPVVASTIIDLNNHLTYNHFFSVLGIHKLYLDASEQNVQYLVKIFDPYNQNIDQGSWNKWAFYSNNWSYSRKKQLSYLYNEKGVFYLTPEDYQKEFEVSYYATVYKDYVVSYYEIPFEKFFHEEIHQIYFNLKNIGNNQKIFISIDSLSVSLLKKNCEFPYSLEEFQAIDKNQKKGQWLYQSKGITATTLIFFNALEGPYEVFIKLIRQKTWIKTFSLSIYAPKNTVSLLSTDNQTKIDTDPCGYCGINGQCNEATKKCKCKPMYTGEYCEEQDFCKTDSDCVNNGRCTPLGTCYCTRRFKGHDCSIKQ